MKARQVVFSETLTKRKHNLADNNPMIAVLDLVHLAIQNPLKSNAVMASLPSTFHEFRTTMEFLEWHARVIHRRVTS